MRGGRPVGLLKCPHCPEQFRTRRWLAFHMWKEHGIG